LFFGIVAWMARALAPSPARAQSRERAGLVEEVKGQAFAQAAAERRRLEQAAPVFIADEVSTGSESRLAMRLGRDTILRLGELARIKIDRFLVNAGGEVTLESGPLLFERPPGRAPSGVHIRSPFALIAVRGTRLFAGPSAGVFGVFVERGAVDVSAGGQRVVVKAGQGTNIAYPGAAPTPPAPWKPARISNAFQSVL
jgi:ferric-dicitrate binding protein FerR (iron transport regulator)